MKYIIIGLGSFGAPLAQKLTAAGNEVIAVDSSMERVEAFKEGVTHTICMDATNEHAVAGLPLQDTDVVIIAIGENQGVNVMATAMFKNLNAKRLISRAINPLHEKVLHAIGVDEIVHPEEETAERWAKKLCYGNVLDSFELNKDTSIIEMNVPPAFVGKSLQELDLRKKYNVLVLTTLKRKHVKSRLGKTSIELQAQGVASPQLVLDAHDVLVVFGNDKELRVLLETGKE